MMKKLYLFFAVLCSLLGAQTANAIAAGSVIYMDANGYWDKDGVSMSAHVWDGSGNSAWIDFSEQNSDGYYIIELPSGSSNWTGIKFARGASYDNNHNWNTYNTTGDLTFDGNLFKVTSWSGGVWSTYTAPDDSGDDDDTTTGSVIYLNASNGFDGASAYMHAYVWNGSKKAWIDITEQNCDGYYIVNLPSGTWTNIIFVRSEGDISSFDGGYWNKTGDLTFDGNLFTVNSDCVSGTWSDYTPRCVELPTYAWKVTATTAEPAVFLMSKIMNNERVTPEYQLTKNSDGKYELKNFVMIPNATFYFRVFTSSTAYTDYKSNGSTGNWSFYDGLGIVSHSNLTATANNALLENGSNPFIWKLGFTMTNLTVDFSENQVLFNLIINKENPSTWESAPEGCQGMPYVGLVGTSTTQAQRFVNPNYDVNNVFTTARAWQDGYVQYDADGNVMVYASGVSSTIYGEGAAAGRAMYNTIWPPRNTISFDYNGFESSSNDLRLNYVGVKKRSAANTSNSAANSDEKDYAVYEINSIEMYGAYKVWSGWGGQHEYQNGSEEAYWSTHNNWGYGTWVKDSGTEIEVNTWYDLSGAGQFADGNIDTDAGGDFYFEGKKYFSKVEFWYSLDSDADIQNSGLTLSYVIAYLADGYPKILATRTAKNQITATYDIINPPTDSRNISEWWVDLYKDGELYMERIQSATGSFDPADVEGSFTTDGLTAGLYQYKMYAIYEGSGDIASVQVGPALSPEIRIFQATIPNNTNVEQLVYIDADGTTEATADAETKYWSFDLRLTAEAPKTLTATELELAEAYVIGVPKGTSYTSVTVEDNATLTPISSKDDLAGNVYSEDLVNYDFDKSSYFMVEPKTDDYAMPTIIFHDVVPGDYTFYVSMCCSDGDEAAWEEYQVSSASAMVNMYKPTTSYSVENFAIVTAGETAAKATDGTNQPLGTSEAQPVSFHSFNKLQTVGGKIGQLMVTNSVLSAWDVTYGLTAAVDETSIDNINLQYDNASVNSTAGVTANFDYLPVAYTSATRGLSTGIDEIDSKEFRWIDAEDFKYGMTVTYTRTSDNVSVDAAASTGTVMINPVENGNVTNYDQLLAYQGTTEDNNDALKKFTVHNQSAWSSTTSDGKVIYFLDAYKAIKLINSTTLNKGVGYYSSNGHSSGCEINYYKETTNGYQLIDVVEGGEVHTGADFSDPFNVLSKAGYVQGDADHNFSELAAQEGMLTIKIGHVGDGEEGQFSGEESAATVQDAIGIVYTVLTAEYPFLVNPTYTAAVSTLSDDDTASVVSLSYPALLSTKGVGTTTDINNIAVDAAGDFRIWPNPAVDVVNVAASAALGTVEIYAVDGRLVKTVEVDDTHAAVEVSDLVKGTYIIRAAGATQRMIKK